VKRFLLSALVVASLAASALSAEPSRVSPRLRQFDLTADFKPGTALGPSTLPGKGALGFSLFGEWRAYDAVSIGFLYTAASLSGTPHVKSSTLDLEGRIYPFFTKAKDAAEWYVMSGLGETLKRDAAHGWWPGRFHGNLGVGQRRFLPGGTSIDLGVVWDATTPTASILHLLSLKAGFGLQFGKVCQNARNQGRETVESSRFYQENREYVERMKREAESARAAQEATGVVTPEPVLAAGNKKKGRVKAIAAPTTEATPVKGKKTKVQATPTVEATPVKGKKTKVQATVTPDATPVKGKKPKATPAVEATPVKGKKTKVQATVTSEATPVKGKKSKVKTTPTPTP